MLNLVHRARVPETPAGQRRPAVVLVHGWQGNEKVMGIFERTVPPQAAIISPRAPLVFAADSFGWYDLDQGEAKTNVSLNPRELASYASVASLLLNLDETVTKE